jgi:hypothetical protein
MKNLFKGVSAFFILFFLTGITLLAVPRYEMKHSMAISFLDSTHRMQQKRQSVPGILSVREDKKIPALLFYYDFNGSIEPWFLHFYRWKTTQKTVK